LLPRIGIGNDILTWLFLVANTFFEVLPFTYLVEPKLVVVVENGKDFVRCKRFGMDASCNVVADFLWLFKVKELLVLRVADAD